MTGGKTPNRLREAMTSWCPKELLAGSLDFLEMQSLIQAAKRSFSILKVTGHKLKTI